MFFSRLAKESLFNFAVSVDIQINMSQFFIQWELGNIFKQRIEGKTEDIDSIKIVVEGVSCFFLRDPEFLCNCSVILCIFSAIKLNVSI